MNGTSVESTKHHTEAAETVQPWKLRHRRKPIDAQDVGVGRSLSALIAFYQVEQANNPQRHMLRGKSPEQILEIAQRHHDAIVDENRYILRGYARAGMKRTYGV